MKEKDPDIIFVPFINDPHQDHKTTNAMLQGALQRTSKKWDALKIFCYEVWALVPANIYSNIDQYMEQKRRLLLMYETPMRSVNYVERCAQFHAYNAFLHTRKNGFAESFLELDAETYCQLICSEQKKKPLVP